MDAFDVNALSQIIGSVGFPVAMCIYMVHTNKQTLDRLTETIHNNTNVMLKILERFDVSIPLSYIKGEVEKE